MKIFIKSTIIGISLLVSVIGSGCSKKEEAPAATPSESSYDTSYSSSTSSTNDESNDQPTGYYGDKTMNVGTPHNGTEYNLDVEFDGDNPSTIYFPKGGNVDLTDCSGGNGSWECTDEEGQEWTVEE